MMASSDVDEIVDWLVARIAREKKIPPDDIQLGAAFADFGLGSMSAVVMSGELEESFGFEEVGPSAFYDYPNIQKLAEHLAELPRANADA